MCPHYEDVRVNIRGKEDDADDADYDSQSLNNMILGLLGGMS